MVIRKFYRIIVYSVLILLIVLTNSVSVLAQTAGIDYCVERYRTDDINECVYILHQQGIMFVDPLGASRSTSDSCNLTSSLDGALSLSYPNYDNVSEVAKKFEDFIKSKRPNSPWLTVQNLGTRIVEEGKQYNANPFLMITIGKTESNFSTAGTASTVQNNPFGIKAGGGGYVTFPTVEAGLFNENGILAGLQRRLSDHPNYKEVKSMYEYFSVHNTGQILYPGDNYYSGDPEMPGAVVSSEGDTGYGPVEYWRNAMNDYNEIFGTDLPTTPPQRVTEISTQGTSCGGSYPPGEGGWDLPGEGENPLVYFSQLYACDETPPADRAFAKTCDPAVGENAFGSDSYGSGTIEKCGCGPTSIATIASTLTGTRVTPFQVAEWSAANNGVDPDGCGSNWFWQSQEAEKEFGLKFDSISVSDFSSTLKSGKLILVSVSAFPTPESEIGGHITVIRKVDDSGNYYFADPYSGGWGAETSEGSSRMPFTEAELSGMIKGSWAVGRL